MTDKDLLELQESIKNLPDEVSIPISVGVLRDLIRAVEVDHKNHPLAVYDFTRCMTIMGTSEIPDIDRYDRRPRTICDSFVYMNKYRNSGEDRD